AQADQALSDCKTRRAYSQLTMLNASASLAHWYRHKEAAEQQAAGLAEERQRLRQERMHRAAQAQAIRNEWRTQQEQAHGRELGVNDLRHRRDALAGRLGEDYEMDFPAAYREWAAAGAPAEPALAGPPAHAGITD